MEFMLINICKQKCTSKEYIYVCLSDCLRLFHLYFTSKIFRNCTLFSCPSFSEICIFSGNNLVSQFYIFTFGSSVCCDNDLIHYLLRRKQVSIISVWLFSIFTCNEKLLQRHIRIIYANWIDSCIVIQKFTQFAILLNFLVAYFE